MRRRSLRRASGGDLPVAQRDLDVDAKYDWLYTERYEQRDYQITTTGRQAMLPGAVRVELS